MLLSTVDFETLLFKDFMKASLTNKLASKYISV